MQPRLVWMNRRTAFEENLDKVMNADAQLQGLGREFQSLMQENRDALAVAAEARRQQLALRKAAQKCAPPTSPRVTARSCRTD